MVNAKVEMIRSLALFRDCSAADVRWVARVADELDVPAGRTLAREGWTVREFVVVVEGVASAAGEVLLGPGAFYGELGLIHGEPHRHTIETLTGVRLLVFGAGAFRGMVERMPSVANQLLRELVVRVREVDQSDLSLRAVS